MKRKFICVLALIAMTATLFVGCKGKNDTIEITLNEVAHSVFYAPMYVAFEEGYFEDEGLKVNLVNGLGADLYSVLNHHKLTYTFDSYSHY